MSTALFLSRRTVWSLVGDLKRSGMIDFRREGRTHHYSADLDFQLQHPALGERTAREMAKWLMEQPPASPKP